MGKTKGKEKTVIHRTKRCYNCNTHLKLTDDKCTSCGSKVGAINEHGVARKPLDVMGYIMAAVALVALFGFLWWAFIRG